MNCQCSRSTNTGVRGVAHSSFSIAVVLEKTAKIEGKKIELPDRLPLPFS